MEQVKKRRKMLDLLMYVLKGTLIGLAITVLGVFAFAFVLKAIRVDNNIISLVSVLLRVGGVVAGTFFACKKISKRGYIVGAAVGLMYGVLGFAIFSLFKGEAAFKSGLLAEILTSAACGVFAGILCMNIRRR